MEFMQNVATVFTATTAILWMASCRWAPGREHDTSSVYIARSDARWCKTPHIDICVSTAAGSRHSLGALGNFALPVLGLFR
jgi:hypothetical protein